MVQAVTLCPLFLCWAFKMFPDQIVPLKVQSAIPDALMGGILEWLLAYSTVVLGHAYPTFPGSIRQNSVIVWHQDHVIFFCDCLLCDWFCLHLMGIEFSVWTRT